MNLRLLGPASPSISGLREQQPWSSPAWSRSAGSPSATSVPVAVNEVAPHQFIANGSIGEARPAPDASLRVGTGLLSDEIAAATRFVSGPHVTCLLFRSEG